LTLPVLNQLTGKNLLFFQSVDGTLVFVSLVLLAVITLLAGGYPAYFVTQFESVGALKGSGAQDVGSQLLRRSLVVVQLTIACTLVSGSILIVKQLNYLESRPLGFQKEQVISIPLYSQNLNGFFQQTDSTFKSRLQRFRNAIEAQSGIVHTTLSSGAPGVGAVYRGVIPEGFAKEDNLFCATISADYDFLSAYGMELVAGRSFSRDFATYPKEAFIINETAVNEFKWDSPAQALGKTINREGKEGRVVGVVKDFNFAALTTPISALIVSIDPNQFNTLSIKFENRNIETMISQL
jgi:putative ABC transport system permease protein